MLRCHGAKIPWHVDVRETEGMCKPIDGIVCRDAVVSGNEDHLQLLWRAVTGRRETTCEFEALDVGVQFGAKAIREIGAEKVF